MDDEKNKTLVQLGGYEDVGFRPGAGKHILRTKSKDTWDLMSDTGKLGHNYLHRKFNGEHLTTIVDPHLNYIYVPAQEFINVASALMTQFEARDYTCENEFDHCVFKMPCDNVPNKNLDFYLHFFDNNGG